MAFQSTRIFAQILLLGLSTPCFDQIEAALIQACPPGAKWLPCLGCHSYCLVKDRPCIIDCKEGCVCEDPRFVIFEGACIPRVYCLNEVCPTGARWSICSGCQSYCPVKDTVCTEYCEDGCVCEDPGYVIHDDACIPRSNCPEINACPAGSKWSMCSGCEAFCPVIGMICTTDCRDGCVCEDPGYVIHDGACIPRENCPEIKICPTGTKWSMCSGCHSYCPVKGTVCTVDCKVGCVCEDPRYVIHEGVCIPRSDCPDPEMKVCPKGAKWSRCSGCGSYCPVKNTTCATVCKEGCVCEDPRYVIHKGSCIPRSNCPDTEIKVRCPPNQIYGCMRPCFSNCDNLNSTYEACPMICKLGCDCLEGFVFQSKDSKVCVPVSKCKVSCPEGMEFRPCNMYPLRTCNTLGIRPIPYRNCKPRCVCQEGSVLVRTPKPKCIKETMCPKQPKPV